MQEIDVLLDEQPKLAMELVHLAIRNRQAHNELESYNNTKQFKFAHRLTITANYKKQQREELIKLKTENPKAFLNEITNLQQNIRRIESQIRTKKYKNEEELQAWQENLERARIKEQEIINLM